MEKMILSLKNIYMLLMTEDFPIYSEGVISRSDRRGLTMLRFWKGQSVEEFRCLPRGKMLWRNDGKCNRYTSYLCNRSAEIKTYSEYAQELASQVNVSSLRNQIGRFTDFLSARKYRHDILLRRIREMMRLTEAEDPRVTREIADQLQIHEKRNTVNEKDVQSHFPHNDSPAAFAHADSLWNAGSQK